MQAGTEPSDRRIGQWVGGRWRVESVLGSGGMATVYAAASSAGERVALKILHPEMARRPDVRERFLREAYVANRIGHPGVVEILEHGDGEEVFLAMELLEGEPLSSRAQRAAEMTLRELLGIADQLLDVLGAAHAAGVIHRDIKPDNVFVTKDGRVKVFDFGIARVLDDVPSDFKTRTGMALGTIPYMAPEQALGRRGQVDGRTDLFALGTLLFRVLAGRRIHEAPSEAELLVAMATEPAPKLRDVAPSVPHAVCAVVDLALAFSREARYPDARTMQQDVRAVLGGLSPPYATSAAPRATSTPHDAPTVATGAAAIEPTLESAAPLVTRLPLSEAFASPPASGTALGMGSPPSAAPLSMGSQQAFVAPPPSAAPLSQPAFASPPPTKRGGGIWVATILGLLTLLVLGAGIALALVYKPWVSATPLVSEPAAADAPTETSRFDARSTRGTSQAPSTTASRSEPSTSRSPSAAAAPAAQPTAPVATTPVAAGLAPASAKPSAPAPTAATTSAKPSTPAPAAATTSAPGAPAPPAPPETPGSHGPPGQEKNKGKGKSK